MYAIIETGGKQYKVTEGTTVKVEKLDHEVGSEIEISEVIMISNDGDLKVGKPYVENAKVSAEVVEQGKDKKVMSFKYKPKTGYRRKVGHRQHFTRLKINKING